MPVVGYLHPASPGPNAHLLAIIRQILAEAGYVEGRNVTIEYRFAESQYDRLTVLAAELVRRQATVIVAPNTPAALAAKAATATIPIVFSAADDPIKLSLVASLARPGGNVTGVYYFNTELGTKQLGLLREIVPGAARLVTTGTGLHDARIALDKIARGVHFYVRGVTLLSGGSYDEFQATRTPESIGCDCCSFGGGRLLLH